MKTNLTNIHSDESFLKKLETTIKLYENREKSIGLLGAEKTVLKYLVLILKIAKKEEPLKGSQESYISIQRVLTDDPGIFMADIVSELSYYFSNIYTIPS